MDYCHIIQPDGTIMLGHKSCENLSYKKIQKGNTTIIRTNTGFIMKLKPYVPTPIDVDLDSDIDSDYD